MATQQIAQSDWEEFLAAFSAHNQTRKVNIEMESTELGPQRLVNGEPLLGVEPDLKDEHEPTIVVVAGDPEGGEPAALTHEVMNPRSIWIKEDDSGKAEALDIETDEGRTIIQFV
ncbi:MAG: DUF5335 family protein [Armatimonadota bacterium]